MHRLASPWRHRLLQQWLTVGLAVVLLIGAGIIIAVAATIIPGRAIMCGVVALPAKPLAALVAKAVAMVCICRRAGIASRSGTHTRLLFR